MVFKDGKAYDLTKRFDSVRGPCGQY
jgi:hypothetical protein